MTVIAKQSAPLTPAEFAERLRDYYRDLDIKDRHVAADKLMCSLLEMMGYTEGIAEFRDWDKWYA